MASFLTKVIRDAFREIVLEEVVRVLREEQDECFKSACDYRNPSRETFHILAIVLGHLCAKFDARRIRRVP